MSTSPLEQFRQDIKGRLKANSTNHPLQTATKNFIHEIVGAQYAYNFHWMGVPVIQIPQDLMAMQEIMWKVRPDYIIETGVAHGGSLIFYASMLKLMGGKKVIGIDIDIRQHNRAEIEKHPMYDHIELIQGSSISEETLAQVKKLVPVGSTVLVTLDSNHSHQHVLEELRLYTPFVSLNSYCVVYDTGIEDLPLELSMGRPWGPGNSPKSALREFLKTNPSFEIDKDIDHQLLITAASDGFLKRVR